MKNLTPGKAVDGLSYLQRIIAIILTGVLLVACTACTGGGSNETLSGVSVAELMEREDPSAYSYASYHSTLPLGSIAEAGGPEWSTLNEEPLMQIQDALKLLHVDPESLERLPLGSGLDHGSAILATLVIYTELGTEFNLEITREDGVYLTAYQHWGEVLHYDCAGKLDAFEEALDAVTQLLNTLPHRLTLSAVPYEFHIESTALNLILTNQLDEDVLVDHAVVISRYQDGGWTKIATVEAWEGPSEAMAGATLSIPLSLNDDLLQPGSYCATITCLAEGDLHELTANYTVSEVAFDGSYLPIPEMTEENADYFQRYLRYWSFYNPFDQDFSKTEPIPVLRTYLAARASDEFLTAEPSNPAPAADLEGPIMRRFPMTEAQIREAAQLYTEAFGTGEYYDEAAGLYYFGDGYGGAGSTGIVIDSWAEGELLVLDCIWYALDNRPMFRHTLFIETQENGEYRFVENHAEILSDQWYLEDPEHDHDNEYDTVFDLTS